MQQLITGELQQLIPELPQQVPVESKAKQFEPISQKQSVDESLLEQQILRSHFRIAIPVNKVNPINGQAGRLKDLDKQSILTDKNDDNITSNGQRNDSSQR